MRAADNPNVKKIFSVTSGELKLTFMFGANNRLYQLGFGDVDAKIEFLLKCLHANGNFILHMVMVC